MGEPTPPSGATTSTLPPSREAAAAAAWAAAAGGSNGTCAPSVAPLEGLNAAAYWAGVVQRDGACALPGVNIKYDNFMECMWRAVQRGYVTHDHACFVRDGLRYGFRCGIDTGQLHGHRFYRNYPTATEHRAAVTTAIMKRVDKGKTLVLGAWTPQAKEQLRASFAKCIKFPLGAVPKSLEEGVYRPYSDHTKTGVNAATCMDMLRHSLTAYSDVAEYLRRGFFMRVSDVDDAFPMLPLHPDVWPFFLFSFWASDDASVETLFLHLCGDFGTRGMPGTFKIFFVDVVVQMARSELVLKLPMAIYVDDVGLIAPRRDRADDEMGAFHEWAERVCGVRFKALKDKWAAQEQLFLGFWWNSLTLTRTLDERKLAPYIALLLDFAGRRSVTLHEMQSLAGKVQRAVMTLPHGAACLMANMFALMQGVNQPWQRRRTTAAVRRDWADIAELLQLNMGRGYYSYANLRRAPLVLSDASKSKAYTGGGFVSQCGRYGYWRYGTSAARKPIDYLEGDTVVHTAELIGDSWRGCLVPFGVDNQAFQLSAVKGWSHAPRLQELLRRLFALQIQGDYVLEFFWLATDKNVLADHLSRDREHDFLAAAAALGFLADGVDVTCVASRTLRQLGPGYASNNLRDGPRGWTAQQVSVTYGRTDLYRGLPARHADRLDEILDNRLRPSSMRTVEAALSRWRTTCAEEGWHEVIKTEDPERGGKMAAFVLDMCDDTELPYTTIKSYEWGLRTWMKLQRQADPVLGVLGWDDFMVSVKVITWVTYEPRREIPLDVIEAALYAVDKAVFWEVQSAFWILAQFFTFARSESSCPKNYTGPESFDGNFHWQEKDVRGKKARDGSLYVAIRMKGNKVDPRMERPEAQGDGDWTPVGDVPGTVFSIVEWFLLLVKLKPTEPSDDAPFFVARDGVRAYRYQDAVDDMRTLFARVDGVEDPSRYGAHGLRVAGYNNSKRGNGEDITVAHGMWRSTAHKRYDRFALKQVLDIPSRMVGARPPMGVEVGTDDDDGQATQPSPRPPVREVQRGRVVRGRPGAQPVAADISPRPPGSAPRPSGRAPKNAAGQSMVWNGASGAWEEPLVASEYDDDDGDDEEDGAEDGADSVMSRPAPPVFHSARLSSQQQGRALPQDIFGREPPDSRRRPPRAADGE